MLRLICCPREAITPRNGSSTRPLCSTVLTVNPDNSQALEQAGPIDLAPLAGADFAFRRPGIGALLTMAQSWYAQGVALGQLLHSVALVPGEARASPCSTGHVQRLASRRKMSPRLRRSRTSWNTAALSEVTNAVAAEAQSGFSETHVTSSAQQKGGGLGFNLGPVTIGGLSGVHH